MLDYLNLFSPFKQKGKCGTLWPMVYLRSKMQLMAEITMSSEITMCSLSQSYSPVCPITCSITVHLVQWLVPSMAALMNKKKNPEAPSRLNF